MNLRYFIVSRAINSSINFTSRHASTHRYYFQGLKGLQRWMHSSLASEDDFSDLGPPIIQGVNTRLKLATEKREYYMQPKEDSRNYTASKPDIKKIPSARDLLQSLDKSSHIRAKFEKSESTHPRTKKSQNARPKNEKPNNACPKTENSQNARPKTEKPDSAHPKTENSQNARPKTEKPDSARPKTENSQNGCPKTDKPDSAPPKTEKPEYACSEFEKPEDTRPNTEKPEDTRPNTEKPENLNKIITNNECNSNIKNSNSICIENVPSAINMPKLLESLSTFGKISSASVENVASGLDRYVVKYENEESSLRAILAGNIAIESFNLPICPLHAPKSVTIRIKDINKDTAYTAVHSICRTIGELVGMVKATENSIDVLFSLKEYSETENILAELNDKIVDDCKWSAHLLANPPSHEVVFKNELPQLRLQVRNWISELKNEVCMKKVYVEDLEYMHLAIMHLEEHDTVNYV
ncbi:hypothetical protein AgCh_036149 [Apium graveolens]